MSIQTGVEEKILISTDLQKGLDTYNNEDVGALAGINLFENYWINLYIRFSYGIVPMLNYESFDALGNFTGHIHDLHNTYLLVGLKIKLFNEISFSFK